jgi:GLPGLI family protein
MQFNNKFMLAILAFLLPILASAQATEGKIIFTQTIKLDIQLPDDAPEEMKKMLPSEQKSQQVLLFNENAALYRDLNDEDKGIDLKHDDGEGGEIQIKMMRPQSVLYRDIPNDKVVESREFMGRNFLVKDAPQTYKWKMLGEKKTILGHNCQKAELVDTSKQVIAWFTTDIPVSVGPETYYGLPGCILEMDIDKGKRTYTANKIELAPLAKDAIKEPTKGKECTRAEYDKTVEEKMKEMGMDNGGKPGAKFMIRH